MAAPRANWKGILKLGAIECGVALCTAASTAERVSFHILNRKTGHRVHRQFVDSETGEPVAHEDQVKGYETGRGNYIQFEPDEVERAVPDADKTLEIRAFVTCSEVDDLYFDRPYYLAPSTSAMLQCSICCATACVRPMSPPLPVPSCFDASVRC